jgi:hypothetical protein
MIESRKRRKKHQAFWKSDFPSIGFGDVIDDYRQASFFFSCRLCFSEILTDTFYDLLHWAGFFQTRYLRNPHILRNERVAANQLSGRSTEQWKSAIMFLAMLEFLEVAMNTITEK